VPLHPAAPATLRAATSSAGSSPYPASASIVTGRRNRRASRARAVGREAPVHLVDPARGPESRQDVVRGRELDRPGRAVLRPLGRCRRRRPVVGHRRSHDDHVCVATRERLPFEISGRRRLDDGDPGGRRDGEVRCEKSHVGAPATRFLGQGDTHTTRGAIADVPNRVERLARSSGRDQDALAAQRFRGASEGDEELVDAGHDVFRLRHAAGPFLAFGELTLHRADEHHTAGAKSRYVLPGGGMLPHARVHRRRDEHRPGVGERGLGQNVVGEPVRKARERVCGERRDREKIGAAQVEGAPSVGEVMRSATCGSYTVLQWGGEEFLVVAREARREDAVVVAERIRSSVANRKFKLADGSTINRTCSIGFAPYPLDGLGPGCLAWEQIIALADQCLYRAKAQGRNRWIGLLTQDDPSVFALGDLPILDLKSVLDTGQVTLVAYRAEER